MPEDSNMGMNETGTTDLTYRLGDVHHSLAVLKEEKADILYGRDGIWGSKKKKELTVAPTFTVMNKGTLLGFVCMAVYEAGFLSRWKARGPPFWTRNSYSTMSPDESRLNWVGRSREDRKPAREVQDGFNVTAVQSSCLQQWSWTTTAYSPQI